jgi:hypothetical protein
VLCCAVLCCAVLCCAVLCCAVCDVLCVLCCVCCVCCAVPALPQEYCPSVADLPTTNGPWAAGEGIKLGAALGAALLHMDQVQVGRE